MNRPLVFAFAASLLFIAGCSLSSVETLSPDRATQAAEINAQIAIYHLANGDVALAREKIEKALQQDSGSLNAHLVAAEIEARLDDVEAEIWHYEQALALEPNHPSALNNYAGFLCRQSQVAEATRIYEKIIADGHYAQRALALTNAGRCLFDAQQWDDAKRYWQRAIAAQTDYPPALFGLAEVELALGDFDAARSHFSRYTALEGESPRQLLLGYRIEKSSGNAQGSAQYRARLEDGFPRSKQSIDLDTW